MKIIVGGGISGLWLAAELKARHIPFVLLERGKLGAGQTLASQGMIHGGTKYALDGLLTPAAAAIGQMPTRWREALAGRGSVNLSQVETERDDQLLWSVDSVATRLVGFFASKAMRSRMQRIEPRDEAAFAEGFSGHLYRLSEPVLKLDTLMPAFIEQLDGHLVQAHVHRLLRDAQGKVTGVESDQGSIQGEVIVCAGEGTEALLNASDLSEPAMQRRPLAMSVVQLTTPIPKVFGHQLGVGNKPKLTVSTHQVDDIQSLYLGGQLAEDGVHRSDAEHIDATQSALREGLGWLTPEPTRIDVFRINRAEPATGQGSRPDHAFVTRLEGAWVAWPTKLALAPALADEILPQLSDDSNTVHLAWPKAQAGGYPWALA